MKKHLLLCFLFFVVFSFHASFRVNATEVKGEAKEDDKNSVTHSSVTHSQEVKQQKSASPAPAMSADTYTIALVIMPRQADGSAWDVTAGADLVLCGAAGCYVSNGLKMAATFYEGGAGLRLIKKAGACRDKLGCVFRGLDLSKLVTEKHSLIEPVDVDYVSHSYMGGVAYTPKDLTNSLFRADNCRLEKSVLDCKVGVHKRNYSLWILPEKLAQEGGEDALDVVLFRGLLHQRALAFASQLFADRKRVQVSALHFYKKLFEGESDVSLDDLEGCVQKPEFLSETFFVLGLADATERRAEELLIDLVGKLPASKVRRLIQRTPQFFWAFKDLTEQLENFANADIYRLDRDQTGVLLRNQAAKKSSSHKEQPNKEQVNKDLVSEKTELIYGWQVKARAKSALSHCDLEN